MRDYRIDYLRGLFALSVVISHASASYTMPNAVLNYYGQFLIHSTLVHPGVVGFIVLSGFCIHYATVNMGNFDIRIYGLRRAIRILPIFWFAVILGILSLICTRSTSINSLNIFDIIARISLIAPLLPINAPLGNSPLDTVVIEAWLYVVYPILYFLFKFKPFHFVVIILLCAACPPVLTLNNFDRAWSFTNLIAFLPFWWIGAIAADIKIDGGNIITKYSAILMNKIHLLYYLYFMILVTFIIFIIDRYTVVGAALRYLFQFILAIGVAKLLTTTSKVRNISIFSSFGLISYSLYAVHMPVLTLVAHFGYKDFQGFSFSVIGSLFVAAIVYWLIESPSHRLARKFSSQIRTNTLRTRE
jgi:peptidoglycan/LPS O-acetylase OafA/YrhL